MSSYEIPPAPKPFTGRYSPASGYSPSPTASIARDLDLRQTQSPSRANDEYYIAFPPSGLPVHGNLELIESYIYLSICSRYRLELCQSQRRFKKRLKN